MHRNNGGRPEEALSTISSGMGKVFAQFAIIITAGSILGQVLEKTGTMKIIASDLIKLSKRSLLALNILGFIFAVPFMCSILDYVVFAPLAKDVSRKLKIPVGITATSLVLGTLASFGLVYPSPVIISAASEMNVDIAEVFLMGLVIALPMTLVGYMYASGSVKINTDIDIIKSSSFQKKSISRASAYIPICLPIWSRSYGKELHEWIEKAIRRSGIVLLDLCGGGALGATFTMTGAGGALGKLFLDLALPALLIPFLVAVAVKTVQGSRVVTIW